MPTQPYPQQSYPMETYPGYRQPPKHPREPQTQLRQPYGRPMREKTALTPRAQLWIIFGIFGLLLCIGGVVAIGTDDCQQWAGNTCVEWSYLPQVIGFAGLILGAVILVSSVVALILQQEPTDRLHAFPVGNLCPTCNRPMVWIPQYQRWFCQYCQRYA